MMVFDPPPSPVYLDYNATTPVAPAVLHALLPHLEQGYGNASSSYALGQQAKRAVEQARAQVATMLDADAPSEVLFLSGGTESINYAIKGSAERERASGKGRNHIITTCIEHVAVLETCRHLETRGYDVTYLPVDEYGRVSEQQVLAALRPTTYFISIMLANNEVGTLQPVAAVSRLVHQFVADHSDMYDRILIHTDASQAIGKVRVSVKELGVDFLTIAGHKLYAPKGIGALYIRDSAPLPAKLIHGASHEQNRRAGTENVPFNVALGTACALIHDNLEVYAKHMAESKTFLQDCLQRELNGSGVEFRVNGHALEVLPNTLSVSFKGVSAVELLSFIETQGICASAGSACHSHSGGDVKVSFVLEAMGVPRDYALGTLRLSVGRDTTQEELKCAAIAIATGIRQLQ